MLEIILINLHLKFIIPTEYKYQLDHSNMVAFTIFMKSLNL